MKKSNPNGPTFVFDDLPLHWQMTRCEKFALSSLVAHANPKVALEVGTYRGGSLQILSAKAEKVYSLDINPESQNALKPKFSNVEFLAGDSRVLLPNLIEKLQSESEPLGFVLIDGDHSKEGVRSDINSVLRFVPNQRVFIVLHDSFHPACREGILSADWKGSPYVHFVEVDFVPGVFHYESFDTAEPRSMWAGLAVALMLPEKRDFALEVHQSQKGLFETVLSNSCHMKPPTPE